MTLPLTHDEQRFLGVRGARRRRRSEPGSGQGVPAKSPAICGRQLVSNLGTVYNLTVYNGSMVLSPLISAPVSPSPTPVIAPPDYRNISMFNTSIFTFNGSGSALVTIPKASVISSGVIKANLSQSETRDLCKTSKSSEDDSASLGYIALVCLILFICCKSSSSHRRSDVVPRYRT